MKERERERERDEKKAKKEDVVMSSGCRKTKARKSFN
jgi:hypothetical protein